MLPRKPADIIRHRLFNQQIIQTSLVTAQQMVGWFGAVQSQEYAMAKWALGLRLQTTNETIEKDFTDGNILRTHVLRPTWHFVTPQDIRWMLALTAPRVHAFNAPYYKKTELDNKILKKSKNVLIKHLRDGNFLDRSQVQNILERSKISAEGMRLALLLMHAELEGIICSGPRKGKQFTYALLDERAPQLRSLSREEALFKLAHRYFTSRSPATLQDFAWWSGLTVKDAKEGAAMLAKDFVMHDNYIVNAQNLDYALTKQERVRATFLMPDYDEYAISYKDREALKFPSRDAIFTRMIMVDGIVAGSWKPAIKSKVVEVETNFFVPLNKLQQQLVSKGIERYKSFLLS